MKIFTYHDIGCLGFIFVFGASFRNLKFILGRDYSEYQNRTNFDSQKNRDDSLSMNHRYGSP